MSQMQRKACPDSVSFTCARACPRLSRLPVLQRLQQREASKGKNKIQSQLGKVGGVCGQQACNCGMAVDACWARGAAVQDSRGHVLA